MAGTMISSHPPPHPHTPTAGSKVGGSTGPLTAKHPGWIPMAVDEGASWVPGGMCRPQALQGPLARFPCGTAAPTLPPPFLGAAAQRAQGVPAQVSGSGDVPCPWWLLWGRLRTPISSMPPHGPCDRRVPTNPGPRGPSANPRPLATEPGTQTAFSSPGRPSPRRGLGLPGTERAGDRRKRDSASWVSLDSLLPGPLPKGVPSLMERPLPLSLSTISLPPASPPPDATLSKVTA